MHLHHLLLCLLAPFAAAASSPNPEVQPANNSFFYAYQAVPATNLSNTRGEGHFLSIGKNENDMATLMADEPHASIGHIVNEDRVEVSGALRGGLWIQIPEHEGEVYGEASQCDGSVCVLNNGALYYEAQQTTEKSLEISGCNGVFCVVGWKTDPGKKGHKWFLQSYPQKGQFLRVTGPYETVQNKSYAEPTKWYGNWLACGQRPPYQLRIADEHAPPLNYRSECDEIRLLPIRKKIEVLGKGIPKKGGAADTTPSPRALAKALLFIMVPVTLFFFSQ